MKYNKLEKVKIPAITFCILIVFLFILLRYHSQHMKLWVPLNYLKLAKLKVPGVSRRKKNKFFVLKFFVTPGWPLVPPKMQHIWSSRLSGFREHLCKHISRF